MQLLFKGMLFMACGLVVAGCTEIRAIYNQKDCFETGKLWDYQEWRCQTEPVFMLYPRSYYPRNRSLWLAMQDEATRKKVLAHIDQLLPGDSSAVVVGKLGVAPLFYYDADSKNLHPVPTHYVMDYYFFRDNNNAGPDTKSQFITLMFDKHERLTQIWYNQILELDGRQLQVPLKIMQASFQQASP